MAINVMGHLKVYPLEVLDNFPMFLLTTTNLDISNKIFLNSQATNIEDGQNIPFYLEHQMLEEIF